MTLGGGLQSLIPKKLATIPLKEGLGGKDETGNVLYVEVGKIKPNPHQPRKNFDKDKLQGLADSIKEHGILQPLVVTKTKDNTYQLIAGERRLNAAKLIGLTKVPIIIRDSSEQEKLELALVENIQRDGLNPIERAYAFKKLIDEFNFIQQDVAKRIGKSRETVANTIRLLDLPAEIQRAVLEDKISEGHGRVILSLPDIEKQILLFKSIVKNKLSVREAEALVKNIASKLPKKNKPKTRKEPYLLELEEKLSSALGTRVKLTRKGKKGKLVIEFFSPDELNGIIKRICRK